MGRDRKEHKRERNAVLILLNLKKNFKHYGTTKVQQSCVQQLRFIILNHNTCAHTHTHTPNHTHKYTTSRRTALFSQGTVAFFTEMKCWELINSGAELELNSMTPCLTCVTQWFFLHIMTSIYIYRYCSLMTRLFILLLQNKSIITRQHLLTMKNPRAMYKGP